MQTLLRGEFGCLELITIVLDEHESLNRTGGWPPNYRDTRPRTFKGTPEYRAQLKRVMHRATYVRWSKRLRRDDRRCADCKRPTHKFRAIGVAPVMHNNLWARHSSPMEMLCDRCCRRRLGRPYTLRDFTVCMWNVDHFHWLDGPPWSHAVSFEHMPGLFFDLPTDKMQKLKAMVQGVAKHFDIPVDLAAGILELNVRRIEAEREPYADMQMIFMRDGLGVDANAE